MHAQDVARFLELQRLDGSGDLRLGELRAWAFLHGDPAQHGSHAAVRAQGTTVIVHDRSGAHGDDNFKVDGCISSSLQASGEAASALAKEHLNLWLSGFNCSIIATGASSTGKSLLLLGAPAGRSNQAVAAESTASGDCKAGDAASGPAASSVLDHLLQGVFREVLSGGSGKDGAGPDEGPSRAGGEAGAADSHAAGPKVWINSWAVVGSEAVDLLEPVKSCEDGGRPQTAGRSGEQQPQGGSLRAGKAAEGGGARQQQWRKQQPPEDGRFTGTAVELRSLGDARRVVAAALERTSSSSSRLGVPPAPPNPESSPSAATVAAPAWQPTAAHVFVQLGLVGPPPACTVSRVTLVDLAGPEPPLLPGSSAHRVSGPSSTPAAKAAGPAGAMAAAEFSSPRGGSGRGGVCLSPPREQQRQRRQAALQRVASKQLERVALMVQDLAQRAAGARSSSAQVRAGGSEPPPPGSLRGCHLCRMLAPLLTGNIQAYLLFAMHASPGRANEAAARQLLRLATHARQIQTLMSRVAGSAADVPEMLPASRVLAAAPPARGSGSPLGASAPAEPAPYRAKASTHTAARGRSQANRESQGRAGPASAAAAVAVAAGELLTATTQPPSAATAVVPLGRLRLQELEAILDQSGNASSSSSLPARRPAAATASRSPPRSPSRPSDVTSRLASFSLGSRSPRQAGPVPGGPSALPAAKQAAAKSPGRRLAPGSPSSSSPTRSLKAASLPQRLQSRRVASPAPARPASSPPRIAAASSSSSYSTTHTLSTLHPRPLTSSSYASLLSHRSSLPTLSSVPTQPVPPARALSPKPQPRSPRPEPSSWSPTPRPKPCTASLPRPSSSGALTKLEQKLSRLQAKRRQRESAQSVRGSLEGGRRGGSSVSPERHWRRDMGGSSGALAASGWRDKQRQQRQLGGLAADAAAAGGNSWLAWQQHVSVNRFDRDSSAADFMSTPPPPPSTATLTAPSPESTWSRSVGRLGQGLAGLASSGSRASSLSLTDLHGSGSAASHKQSTFAAARLGAGFGLGLGRGTLVESLGTGRGLPERELLLGGRSDWPGAVGEQHGDVLLQASLPRGMGVSNGISGFGMRALRGLGLIAGLEESVSALLQPSGVDMGGGGAGPALSGSWAERGGERGWKGPAPAHRADAVVGGWLSSSYKAGLLGMDRVRASADDRRADERAGGVEGSSGGDSTMGLSSFTGGKGPEIGQAGRLPGVRTPGSDALTVGPKPKQLDEGGARAGQGCGADGDRAGGVGGVLGGPAPATGGDAPSGQAAAALRAANEALLGVVGRERETVSGLQSRVRDLELALREAGAAREVLAAELREQALRSRRVAAARLEEDVVQMYEQEIDHLNQQLRLSQAGETEQAGRLAATQLELAALRKEALKVQEGSALADPQAHAAALEATAEASELRDQALSQLRARVRSVEQRAQRAEAELLQERRVARHSALLCRQAEANMGRLKALERDEADRQARAEAAGLEAASARGRADRLQMEVERLRAANELLVAQNQHLLAWRRYHEQRRSEAAEQQEAAAEARLQQQQLQQLTLGSSDNSGARGRAKSPSQNADIGASTASNSSSLPSQPLRDRSNFFGQASSPRPCTAGSGRLGLGGSKAWDSSTAAPAGAGKRAAVASGGAGKPPMGGLVQGPKQGEASVAKGHASRASPAARGERRLSAEPNAGPVPSGLRPRLAPTPPPPETASLDRLIMELSISSHVRALAAETSGEL